MFNKIFKGTAIGLINKMIAAMASFIILPFMLSRLGTDTYGIWVTIVSTIGVMGFLDLGIGLTIINFIAGNENKQEISKYIKTAYIIQFYFIGAIVILFLGLFFFVDWGQIFNIKYISFDILMAILITFVFFFFSIITNSIFSIQIAMQKSITANTWQLFGTLLYLSTLTLVLLYTPNIKWVALASFGVPVVIATINTLLFLYKEQLYYKLNVVVNIEIIKLFIGKSSMFLILQISSLICFQMDCLILAHFLNFNNVAKFSITAKLFSIPTLLLGVYLQILWPAYSKAFKNDQWSWIKKYFYRSTGYALSLSLVFVLTIFLFKDFLLRYWLGGKLQISNSLLLAFSVFVIINIIDINIASMLNGLNKIKVQVYFAILMVVSNVLLSITFVNYWGVTGVIWGSCIASLFFSVIPFLFYIKKLFSENTRPNP
ncbi:oligosaccharide flippase family protein [Pedobacter mucosus]|uniref:oligosaccharide flippase family protein n=1 Tax=Pedobacter mucosus TaxID=2895286 RepID=UPI001EE4DCAD|nr:oligosaccharide flippase family protein [Pedobacter mucosus]UKT63337.1 oligosaccharide flippase family protein [Pedobacter mucosus]